MITASHSLCNPPKGVAQVESEGKEGEPREGGSLRVNVSQCQGKEQEREREVGIGSGIAGEKEGRARERKVEQELEAGRRGRRNAGLFESRIALITRSQNHRILLNRKAHNKTPNGDRICTDSCGAVETVVGLKKVKFLVDMANIG
jgi:hypothetical protein